ncbi:Protein TIFY 5B [Raphanus sativus]|uniref:Protein TIFY n=1 Tax=Raphanus sativus TaxID=3726 RepID=A0A6J0N9E8_RAPSA|nr:protein TIFY 5B-like [Raphanus sativus]KAJ4903609.1 Protein TIFY 5B [Raphanus sativus]
MEMQTNCDLELRLLSPPYDSSSSKTPQPKKESQILTIFYNGHICVSSDLTHLQAKSILSLASKDIEERSLSLKSSDGPDPSIIPNNLTRVHHQKASMKRSLRSFLQKRNVRIQASGPYHHSR